MATNDQKTQLTLGLHEIGALKFGEFTYKSGLKGPMYLDLRLLISYPKIMKGVAKLYGQQLESVKYDRLAGVAYAALPIAGAISLEIEKPWIFMRKEGIAKDHGLGKSLEGEFAEGETVVMIEDLANSGASVVEAATGIRAHGLTINDAVVLLDYQRGGTELLAKNGIKLHAFMTVTELVEIMFAEGKIDASKHKQCLEFLKG